jgi:hypothetical protein
MLWGQGPHLTWLLPIHCLLIMTWHTINKMTDFTNGNPLATRAKTYRQQSFWYD